MDLKELDKENNKLLTSNIASKKPEEVQVQKPGTAKAKPTFKSQVTKPRATSGNTRNVTKKEDQKIAKQPSTARDKKTASSKEPPKKDVRPTSVPKLNLKMTTPQSAQRKQSDVRVNITNMVEVEDQDISGLLSPIDLKESNREITRKLDELCQSYEAKERMLNDENNKF